MFYGGLLHTSKKNSRCYRGIKEKKILTVSIAAYNVEEFLKDTLESLCDKRYINDIEVLVIDDGSKDNTGIIATEFQKKYPTSIKYIAKENGGHGSTINKGIELASGKYFRILDGDDYVDRDAFYSYITKLKSCDIDVVITDYWWVDNLKNKYQHGHKIFSVLQNNVEFQYDHSIDSSIFGLSTLSIKTELLQMANVKITEKCFYVDVEFIIWAVYLSKSYVYFNDKVYKTVIPRNVRVSEAPSYGMPITEYDPKSKGAKAYVKFAKEFLKINEEEKKAKHSL